MKHDAEEAQKLSTTAPILPLITQPANDTPLPDPRHRYAPVIELVTGQQATQ